MPRDTHVIVARVRIHGGLTIDAEQEDSVEGEPGGRLVVKLPFHYDEVSRRRDDFRLRLEATFNGVEADAVEHVHKDRRGLPDDQRGFVMREFALPGPGTYRLSYRAQATYKEAGDTVQAERDGAIEVVVVGSGDRI